MVDGALVPADRQFVKGCKVIDGDTLVPPVLELLLVESTRAGKLWEDLHGKRFENLSLENVCLKHLRIETNRRLSGLSGLHQRIHHITYVYESLK